jgi:hypothetical protein
VLEQVRAAGARRLAVVFDEDIYGREMAGGVVAGARRDAPEPVTTGRPLRVRADGRMTPD